MSIDLSKLTPASQWTPDFDNGSIDGVLAMVQHGNVNTITRTGETFSHTALAFIALARNAFDGDPEAVAWWEANRTKRENQCLIP